MFQPFPTSGLEWVHPKDLNSNKYSSNGSTVCLLEVDLEYPI